MTCGATVGRIFGLRLLGRGLGSGWFAERLHGNALVTHFEDLQLLRRRAREPDAVAWARLHQGARQRRHPADVVAIQIDFVGADDADHLFRAGALA